MCVASTYATCLSTRLVESSLVNKQVATYKAWQDMGFILWPLRWKMCIPQINKSMMTIFFTIYIYLSWKNCAGWCFYNFIQEL